MSIRNQGSRSLPTIRHLPRLLCLGFALLECGPLGAQNSAGEYFKQGFDAIRSGDFARAEAEVKAGLKIDPSSPAGYDLLGITYDGQDQFQQAESAYRQALKLNPKFVPARNDLGRSLYRQGKAQAASQEFEGVLRFEPKNFTANYNLGVTSLEAKNYRKAAKHLQVAVERAPSDASALLALTHAYLGAGEKVHAVAAARRLVALSPSDPRLRFSLGTLFLEWKQYAESVEELEQARVAEPRNFEVLYNLGQAYVHVKKYAEAEDALLHALSVHDDSVETLYQLGVLYAQSGHPDQAIEILVRARQLAPQRPEILLLLGRESIQEGFTEDAVNVLKDCIRIDPEKIEPHLLLGEALTKGKQFLPALKQYEKVAQLDPSNAESFVLVGRTLWYAGQRRESERALRKALELDTHNAEAAYYLGLFASNEANYPAAESWLNQALRSDPHHLGALYELGTTYMRAHDFVRARDYLERARAAAPSFSQIYYRLATVYRQSGNSERAAEMLALFKKYDESDAQRRVTYPQGLLDFVKETSGLPERERLERYRQALLKAEEKKGDDPHTLFFLAQIFLKLGQKQEGLRRLRKIAALEPDNASANVRSALLLASFNDYPAAVEMLSTLLGKQPASDEARFALASLYCRIGRGLEAGEILGEVSAGFRVRAAYHNLLGRIASREGDSARALEEVRRSVALEPENEDYITDAALELALAGRMDEARKVIEKARKDLPSSGRIVFAQGVWLELARLRKESAAAYRQAADLSWHWQAPYLALGNVLRELGSPKDALEELNQAESLFTASPWPHWLKALALTKSGADSESQSEFTRALDLASNQPEIFPALLASSLRRGDCGAAREISTKMSALGFASEIDIDRWCGKSVTSPSAPGPALEKALARHSELKLLLEMAREEPWPGGGAPGGIESIKSTAHSQKSSP